MRHINKKTLIKYIYILLTCTSLNAFSQHKANVIYENRFIKYENLNFYFLDTVYPFTVFIDPSGSFFFRSGFYKLSDTVSERLIYIKNKQTNVVRTDTLIKKSDSIIKINSYYPLLIKHDSSIINHYPFDFKAGISFELEYSFILSLLKEPKIYNKKDLKSIRIIFPTKTDGIERNYAAIRLEYGLKDKLIYSSGEFDSNVNYHLSSKDSCIISKKQISLVDKILNRINFTKENYFTEVGPYVYPNFLIEYKTSDCYFVIRKQYLSNDKNEKEFNRLLFSLLEIKNKCMIKK